MGLVWWVFLGLLCNIVFFTKTFVASDIKGSRFGTNTPFRVWVHFTGNKPMHFSSASYFGGIRVVHHFVEDVFRWAEVETSNADTTDTLLLVPSMSSNKDGPSKNVWLKRTCHDPVTEPQNAKGWFRIELYWLNWIFIVYRVAMIIPRRILTSRDIQCMTRPSGTCLPMIWLDVQRAWAKRLCCTGPHGKWGEWCCESWLFKQ